MTKSSRIFVGYTEFTVPELLELDWIGIEELTNFNNKYGNDDKVGAYLPQFSILNIDLRVIFFG